MKRDFRDYNFSFFCEIIFFFLEFLYQKQEKGKYYSEFVRNSLVERRRFIPILIHEF